MTLDQHASAARRDPVKGMPAFVAALRDDAELLKETRARLAYYQGPMRAGFPPRMEACWVSRMTETVLLAALEAVDKTPDVPAGGMNV